MSSELASRLKAVADETRLRILHLIDQGGPEICVCDMVAVLKLPQSTISRQLMKLRSLGLVSDERDGMWINYSMQDSSDPAWSNLLRALRESWHLDPVLLQDKALFNQLHAKDQIVRCKRTKAREAKS